MPRDLPRFFERLHVVSVSHLPRLEIVSTALRVLLAAVSPHRCGHMALENIRVNYDWFQLVLVLHLRTNMDVIST